jgi:hypothetical protein
LLAAGRLTADRQQSTGNSLQRRSRNWEIGAGDSAGRIEREEEGGVKPPNTRSWDGEGAKDAGGIDGTGEN